MKPTCGMCGGYFADAATLRRHVAMIHSASADELKALANRAKARDAAKEADPEAPDEDEVADAIASITLERDEQAAIRSILGLD